MGNPEIFKELRFGGLPKDQLIAQLVAAGIRFNPYAQVLFEHASFALPGAVMNMQLVKCTAASLGLSGAFSLDQVLARARERALSPCPLALGAFLRLAYSAQPPGDYLTIASERAEGREGFPAGFYLRNHEGALWLRGYCADGECDWPPENEFVFAVTREG